MELRIKATAEFFMAGDVMVRMWTGRAYHDDGSHQPVVALVTAVGFAGQGPAMAEGLVSIPAPDADSARRWAEQVLAGQEIEDPKD